MTQLQTKNDIEFSLAAAAARLGIPFETVQRWRAANYYPIPKQLYFHAAAHEADKRGKTSVDEIGLGGARGGAKSHGVLAQLALDDCQRQPGLKCLWLRQVGLAAKEALEDLVPRVVQIPHRFVTSPIPKITFPHGSVIIAGHFQNEKDIARYLGIEYDVIALEEATQLTKSKNEKLNGSLRTSKPNWKPRRYYTTNPGGVGHNWFKDTFINPLRNNNQTTTRFIQSTFRDNPYLNPEYIGMLDKLTGWLRDAWRDGSWDVFAGQFFSNFSYDRHVFNPSDLPSDPKKMGLEVWSSLDYGYKHWMISHLFCKYDGDTIILDEFARRQTLIETYAEGFHKWLEKWGLTVHDLLGVPAGNDVFATKGDSGSSYAEEFERCGIKLMSANMKREHGAGILLKMLGDEKHGIEPSLKISSNCKKLIETLPVLEHNPKKPNDVLKVDADDQGEGGDDPYDSARYGLATDLSLGVLI